MQIDIVFNITDFAIDLNDFIVFTLAVLYALTILVIADLSRRRFNLGSEFTRRIVHLFAGGAIWSLPYYTHAWVGTIVALLFVIMLALANQERFSKFFQAMARPEDLDHGSVRGPFWYAVSITLITAVFTITGNEQLYCFAAAGIHIMMFGDGMSAPIGMKFGANHTYTIFGSKRSIQGCLALLIFGILGAFLALWFFGVFHYGIFLVGSSILIFEMIIISVFGGFSAMLIELVSPKGTDNTTVPILTTVLMIYLGVLLGLVSI